MLASRMLHHAGQSDPTDPGIMRFPFMCPGTRVLARLARGARRPAGGGVRRGCHLLRHLAPQHADAVPRARATTIRPGSGEPLAALFEAMYRATSTAMSEAAGRYVPMGTEVMTETSIGLFDFSQHRADGGPYASFEPVPFRDWLLDGRAERIPLLTYVFGERAPLRMDGWAKLSPEAGDLWYWVAATVLLEGGLLEVNGEFSPLEDVDGWTEDVSESYADIVPRGFGIDPAKAAFLGQVARTRVGPANPWLARGRMLPPPVVEAPTIEPDWYAYNAGQDHSMYDTRGTMRVPSVLARAWRLDGRDAWLVANVSDQRPGRARRRRRGRHARPPHPLPRTLTTRTRKEPSSVDRFETLVGSPLSGLPMLRDSTSRRASSWDRTGGNDDRLHIQPGQEAVLADIAGAGVVRHIWVTIACDEPDFLRKVVLRAWWDGEP